MHTNNTAEQVRHHTCFYFCCHPRGLEVEILGQPNSYMIIKELPRSITIKIKIKIESLQSLRGNNSTEKAIKSKENVGENKHLLSHTKVQLEQEIAKIPPRWYVLSSSKSYKKMPFYPCYLCFMKILLSHLLLPLNFGTRCLKYQHLTVIL